MLIYLIFIINLINNLIYYYFLFKIFWSWIKIFWTLSACRRGCVGVSWSLSPVLVWDTSLEPVIHTLSQVNTQHIYLIKALSLFIQNHQTLITKISYCFFHFLGGRGRRDFQLLILLSNTGTINSLFHCILILKDYIFYCLVKFYVTNNTHLSLIYISN